mmetsp:Transcript_57062/g.184778  ORF Transcript_57062/g.184778 Transcript_57062/m.184778 type:complete len:86 (+) Transcript_57062:935-1192(+)
MALHATRLLRAAPRAEAATATTPTAAAAEALLKPAPVDHEAAALAAAAGAAAEAGGPRTAMLELSGASTKAESEAIAHWCGRRPT